MKEKIKVTPNPNIGRKNSIKCKCGRWHVRAEVGVCPYCVTTSLGRQNAALIEDLRVAVAEIENMKTRISIVKSDYSNANAEARELQGEIKGLKYAIRVSASMGERG